ncbi:DinB family protein [Planctomycetes bacterium K23_9]|uniref:DinB superfamily protein n=1 Tax=Stieleria marina TaxID=1930275 RepID=A0A517P2K1_9BACT|nr:DinB superfamily protein [Planctomycetes bacterium K23_9]
MKPPQESSLASRRPADSEFTEPYHRDLVNRLDGPCATTVLTDQMYWLCELASSISTLQIDTVHAPYSWTVRQVFEHCADAERVFGYRMLRIAAGDQTNLPSWDENAYAESRFGLGNFTHIVTELGALRKANVMLLRRIIPGCWDKTGFVDEKEISLRAIAWITAGHLHHHLEIVEKRCEITVDRKMPVEKPTGQPAG